MKRTISIAVVFALVVAGFIATIKISNLGPGPLASVHSDEPELRGTDSCVACHGTEGNDFSAACGKCHAQIGEQIAKQTGFHGTIASDEAKACEKCHLEHLGPDAPLVGDRAFVRSGFKSASEFEHKGLPFDLVGRHLEIGCDKCHERAFTPRLHKGEHRFLGLSTACKTCHEDPHDGKLADCNACHGQAQPFANAAAFEHDARFPLTGGHSQVACQKCHDAQLLSGVLERPGVRDRKPVRTCSACHESPHSRSYLDGVARATGRRPDVSCTLCHLAGHESFAAADKNQTRAFHDASGFRLAPPHAEVECSKCHSGPAGKSGATFSDRYPGGRSQSNCVVCHGDPHGGQFLDAAGTQKRCTDCHDELRFVPHEFDAARHARTAMPLLGAHKDLACEKCHKLEASHDSRFPQVRKFRGTGSKCVDCHESPHRGQLSGRVALENDCKACHGQAHFRPAMFTIEQHAAAFPLEGAHLAVGCNTCHKPKPGARVDANGRYPVSALVFEGTPRQCEQCHVDVHDKSFNRPGLPRIVDGKTGCVRCHTPDHFDLERPREFRHGFWTGFELVGAHASASCDGCHPQSTPTHGGTRVMAKAKAGCANCHADPHAGQFRSQGKTDCRQCHDPHPGWKASRFDHERDSRFKLGKQHTGLACSKCHRSYPVGETHIVRYKPLGTTCRSCHLDGGRRR